MPLVALSVISDSQLETAFKNCVGLKSVHEEQRKALLEKIY